MSSSAFTGDERRDYVRLRENLEARYRKLTPGEETGSWEKAIIENISPRGLCLDLANAKTHFTPSQSRIEIEFSFPTGGDDGAPSAETIKVGGKVVWQARMKETLLVGVSFPDISKGTRQAIRDYIVRMYVRSYREG